jgi:biopolymer transport protein TolR
MRRSRHGAGRLISGINITPLTDVVLVLLVIFMIATPLLIRSEIKVNLPRTASADAAAESSLVITIDPAGTIYLNGARVAFTDLRGALGAALRKQANAPVIIMGDRDVRYDLVVQVLEIARSSGVSRLSLAVQTTKK